MYTCSIIVWLILATLLKLDSDRLCCKRPEPLRSQIRAAYSDSLRPLWFVLLGLAGIGLLASWLMRALPLTASLDTDWGLRDEEKQDNLASSIA